jgi:MinD-like ATPase involved in chromosome partitioning or flagellar assembly
VRPRARFVVLGLAPAGSEWLRALARWAGPDTSPVELVVCRSAEEVRARLAGGRPFSALLVDAAMPAGSRDLIHAATEAGCPAVVCGVPAGRRRRYATGAAAVLGATWTEDDLLRVLADHNAPVALPHDQHAPRRPGGEGPRASLVAVSGAGGAGASTVAIALAHGLAEPHAIRPALLCDLRLHAELGVLHHIRGMTPGVDDLVDLFRAAEPSPEHVLAMTTPIEGRRYRLLLGLRESTAWATIGPRAFDAALDGLRRVAACVVADVDADLEGEDDGGSIDVEERNVMSRATCAAADVVVVVGAAGTKGVHTLTRVLRAMLAFGVPPERVVTVVNRAPNHLRERAAILRAVAAVTGPGALTASVFVPDRPSDDALTLLDEISEPLIRAVRDRWSIVGTNARRASRLRRVVPGSLGSWASSTGG